MWIIIWITLRLCMGLIFVFSGSRKLSNRAEFRIALLSFRLVPFPFISLLTWLIPTLEVLIGVCLIMGVFSWTMALFLLLLLIIFSGALAIAWMLGREVSCNCFGPQTSSTSTFYPYALTRNLCLCALDLVLLFAPPEAHQFTITTLINTPIACVSLLLTGAFALCWLLVSLMNTIRKTVHLQHSLK